MRTFRGRYLVPSTIPISVMPQSVFDGSSFFGSLRNSARSSLASKEYKATVQLLDDSETILCDFKKNDTGQYLLDWVCDYMNLIEKDYFGLRFQDINMHRYWLDTTKQITKQVKGGSTLVFRLRIRYYPSDPTVLKEEITRYQLFLQLRRDLLHGRLYCPPHEAVQLGAYIMQSELGDYDDEELNQGYVSEYKLFLKQTSKIEDKIAIAHRELKGLTPADAELEFLKRAAQLDTYGFYPHTVKDQKGNSIYIGVTHQGIIVYQANHKVHAIDWNSLDRVDYLGKEYRVYPKSTYFDDGLRAETENEKKLERSRDKVQNSAVDSNHSLHVSSTHDSALSRRRVENGIRDTSSNSSVRLPHSPNMSGVTLCPNRHFSPSREPIASSPSFPRESNRDIRYPISSTPVFSARIPLLSRGSTFRFGTGRVLYEIKELEAPGRQPVGFARYHLEKQPNRDERQPPWTKAYSTLPRVQRPNNNKTSEESVLNTSLNLEMSNGGNDANRTSSPTIPMLNSAESIGSPTIDLSPVTPSSSQPDNVTTFTIHLSRVEKSPRPPDPSADCLLSTPSSAVHSKMYTINESMRSPDTIQPRDRAVNPSMWQLFLRLVNTLTFLVIFITITLVFAFEVHDGQFREFVDSVPGADEFRHDIYEPSRQYVLEQYDRLFGRR